MSIECPVCGEKALELIIGHGRTIPTHLGVIVIPDNLAVPECSNCGTRPIDWKTAKVLDRILVK